MLLVQRLRRLRREETMHASIMTTEPFATISSDTIFASFASRLILILTWQTCSYPLSSVIYFMSISSPIAAVCMLLEYDMAL